MLSAFGKQNNINNKPGAKKRPIHKHYIGLQVTLKWLDRTGLAEVCEN